MPDAIYPNDETTAYAGLVEKLKENAGSTDQSGRMVFDSAAGGEYLNELTHREVDGLSMPEEIGVILDGIKTGEQSNDQKVRSGFVASLGDAINFYEKEHGEEIPADILRWASHQGAGTFDSASNEHHDPLSMQPNRAIIATTTAITEAIPFAHYLPADIKSNEAKLIVLSHHAGSDWGDYQKGDLMDGANNGGRYLDSARTIKLAADGSGLFTTMISKDNPEICDPAAPRVKLIRGRTLILVNGFTVGGENGKSTGENSPISGEIILKDTQHVLVGSVKPDTGEVSVSFTPPLPTDSVVYAEGYIDYEVQPDLAPKLNTNAQSYSMLANAWRGLAYQTIDSRTQMQNEIGIDISTEALLSIRTQFSNERFYNVLRKANMLANNQLHNWNFNLAEQAYNKVRADIWQDFAPTLNEADQKMAINTMDHGVTDLVVDQKILSQFIGLPKELFQSSGISARAGIYRAGKFLGKNVYFNPKAKSVPNGSRIIAIGRSTQVARNPFVLGDAVAPVAIPLSTDGSLDKGIGYYARNFTRTNPHLESAMGVAAIDITGLPN